MEELRVDMRERTPEEQAVYDRQAQAMKAVMKSMNSFKSAFEVEIGVE